MVLTFLKTKKIDRLTYLGFFLILLGFYIFETVFLIPITQQGNFLNLGRIFIFLNIFLFIVAILYPIFRLRDIGRSGWWILLFLIPVINLIFPFYLLLKKGKHEQQST